MNECIVNIQVRMVFLYDIQEDGMEKIKKLKPEILVKLV